jgi:hypothetical protein
MQAKRLKSEASDKSCRLAAETATTGGWFANHQMKGGGPVLDIEIRECATTNELLLRANTLIEGKREHLGGREAVANQALNLVTGERLVAMARETNELGVGVPALECWQGVGGVWAQRNVLAHEDRLVSADPALSLRSDHAVTVYDRPDA